MDGGRDLRCRWVSTAFTSLAIIIAVQLGAVSSEPATCNSELCNGFSNEVERNVLNITVEFRPSSMATLDAFQQVLNVDNASYSAWLNQTVQEICTVACVSGCVPAVSSFQSFPFLSALVEVGAKEAVCGKRNVNRSVFRTTLEARLVDITRASYQPNSQLMPIVSTQASVIRMSAMELFESYIINASTPTPEPSTDSRQLALKIAMYCSGCLKFSRDGPHKFVAVSETSSVIRTSEFGTSEIHGTGAVSDVADVMNGRYRLEGNNIVRIDDQPSRFGHGVLGFMHRDTKEWAGPMPQVAEDSDTRTNVSRMSQNDVMSSVHGMMPTVPPQALHGAVFARRGSNTSALASTTSHGMRVGCRSRNLSSENHHLSMPHGATLPSGPGRRMGAFMRLISRYKVDFDDLTFYKEIGRGSCKTVYHGRWCSTAVAIVRMKKGGMATEARIMQRLGTHPNLVQFYRWARDHHGNEYMIMELVANGSLEKFLLVRSSTLDFMDKLKMCEQICDAMCELAREGLLHCDLAARNVLVANVSSIHVKVADFGMAREWEFQGAADGDAEKKMLDCIPLRWTAPEVFRSGHWSEKSDVWAFGVTMWEIFTGGEVPFVRDLDDPSNEAIIYHVMSGNYLNRPADCPLVVYSIMEACWAYNREARPTFEMLQQRFHHVRAQIRNIPRPLVLPQGQQGSEARRVEQQLDGLSAEGGAAQVMDLECGVVPGSVNPSPTIKCHGRIPVSNVISPPGVVSAWQHGMPAGDGHIIPESLGHGMALSSNFESQMGIAHHGSMSGIAVSDEASLGMYFPPSGSTATTGTAPNHTGYVSMPALTTSSQAAPGAYLTHESHSMSDAPEIELQRSPYANLQTMIREAEENTRAKPPGNVPSSDD
eukprot:CAMPEP_0177751172 /NCGR_PEP_ID=MMETSP0491_2-20121128/228_1 /TAXON_ID=63592 /ORGANISM="Tetraselmis chuii, Strain PLY429" /LENGTH=879 /DNA_ID=CAMNT_0019266259 /DNA_START=609 /DNA_END=3248 /DNA_ORIENTATION=-